MVLKEIFSTLKSTRRGRLILIVGSGVLAVLLVLILFGDDGSDSPSAPKKKQVLRVLNWTDYIGRHTLQNFERRFNAQIIYETFTSNEELLAEIEEGKNQYDVIFPSVSAIRELISTEKLHEIDHSLIPNSKHLDPKLMNAPADPGNKHCLPYSWGTTGLGINTSKYTRSVITWDVLWDKDVGKRTAILDEARSGLLPAIKKLGFSINTKDPEQIKKAKELMIIQYPLVKAYTSDLTMDLLKSGDVWIAEANSGDIAKLSEEDGRFEFFVPVEGTEIWIDSVCITKRSKAKKLAHEFINFLFEAEESAAFTNETRYATSNTNATKLIRREIISNPAIYPPMEVRERSELQDDVGEAADLYEEAWDDVKRSVLAREISAEEETPAQEAKPDEQPTPQAN